MPHILWCLICVFFPPNLQTSSDINVKMPTYHDNLKHIDNHNGNTGGLTRLNDKMIKGQSSYFTDYHSTDILFWSAPHINVFKRTYRVGHKFYELMFKGLFEFDRCSDFELIVWKSVILSDI